MSLVEIADDDADELPRAEHDGEYVAPNGHRAWFPKGAPLLGGYEPVDDGEANEPQVEGGPSRKRETATQKRKRETAG